MSSEMAGDADEAICRIFSSDRHERAMAALEKVMAVKDEGGDALAVLTVLGETSAISEWEALHEDIAARAEMLAQGFVGVRADGSEHDEMRGYSGGVVSMFRLTPARGPDDRFPADVAARLAEYAGQVVKWLKDQQRRCGATAPLIKHDRFVRLCHEALHGEEPPAYVLAIDDR